MGTKGTPTKYAELLVVLMDFKHSYQLLITMLTTLQTMTCKGMKIHVSSEHEIYGKMDKHLLPITYPRGIK